MTCTAAEKPVAERPCQGTCLPQWLVGEWGACEGSCPTGTQRRQSRCMDARGQDSFACSEESKPITKRPCACERREEHEHNKLVQDEPRDRKYRYNVFLLRDSIFEFCI